MSQLDGGKSVRLGQAGEMDSFRPSSVGMRGLGHAGAKRFVLLVSGTGQYR